MTIQKHTKTINIEDFNTKINKSLYPKYFTQNEIAAFSNKRKKGSLAARYLIKEILIKNFNQKLNFTDIEILNSKLGKPTLAFLIHKNKNTENIHFSLSHSKDIAAVLVIFESHGK